jgi:hypothetical protein
MEPAGMVHALEIIHSLLASDGLLVDIHPSGFPPEITAWRGSRRLMLGYLQESDNFIEYAQASAAIARAVEAGLFTIDRQDEFTYAIHAASVAELRQHLLKNWSDAILPQEIDAGAASFLRSEISSPNPEGDAIEIVMTERVRITRLLPQLSRYNAYV